jgi:hypothetical protein
MLFRAREGRLVDALLAQNRAPLHLESDSNRV